MIGPTQFTWASMLTRWRFDWDRFILIIFVTQLVPFAIWWYIIRSNKWFQFHILTTLYLQRIHLCWKRDTSDARCHWFYYPIAGERPLVRRYPPFLRFWNVNSYTFHELATDPHFARFENMVAKQFKNTEFSIVCLLWLLITNVKKKFMVERSNYLFCYFICSLGVCKKDKCFNFFTKKKAMLSTFVVTLKAIIIWTMEKVTNIIRSWFKY